MHIDYLSITAKIEGLDAQRNAAYTIAHILGGSWLGGRGRNGYSEGLRHDSGAIILWDGMEGMGVHVDLPGDSLAFFQENLPAILEAYEFKASRLDIATDIDDMSVADVLAAGDIVVTRARGRVLVSDLVSGGQTLYIGSLKGGRKLIRLYDKGIEQGSDSKRLRVEVQLRAEYAAVAFAFIQSGGNMADVVLRSIDFRADIGGNVSRRPRLDWWAEAVAAAEGGFAFPRRSPLDGGVERLTRWIDRYMCRPLLKVKLALGDRAFDAMIASACYRLDVGYYAGASPGGALA